MTYNKYSRPNRTLAKPAEHPWSEHQRTIFDWFAMKLNNQKKNLIVDAYAGASKSTTMARAVHFAPEKRVLMTVFNTRNVPDIESKVGYRPGLEVMTLHKLGNRFVKRYWKDIQLNKYGRGKDLANLVCENYRNSGGMDVPYDISYLIGRLCTMGREIIPFATNEDLINLAWRFTLIPDRSYWTKGFDLNFVADMARQAMDLAAEKRIAVKTGYDYTDMIFLPVRNRWLTPEYDLVIVDEAQDLNPVQHALALGVCNPNGRIVMVGDLFQVLYSWRGADMDSLNRLKIELNADVLQLPITYRCGKKIVELAQQYVPNFQAGPKNPEGEIVDISKKEMLEDIRVGDMLLSRTNAPLAKIALTLLRMGKSVRIQGKDIGSGLVTLIKKLAKGGGSSIPNLFDNLNNWEKQEIQLIQSQLDSKGEDWVSSQIEAINDKAEAIRFFAEGITSTDELQNRITAMFDADDSKPIILLSSVHRAKGMEAKRVFILAETLRSHKQEELNICYVAITRAIEYLAFVHDVIEKSVKVDQDDDPRDDAYLEHETDVTIPSYEDSLKTKQFANNIILDGNKLPGDSDLIYNLAVEAIDSGLGKSSGEPGYITNIQNNNEHDNLQDDGTIIDCPF